MCLTALRGRARRPLPSGLGGPSDDPDAPLTPAFEVPWLQPFPDAMPDDPATRIVRRGSLRLALVAAMQALPARQRAVLILRDVLEFGAAETAELLETSPAAVNSALQRARAGLSGVAAEEEIAEPDDAEVGAVLDRYVRSFEAADGDIRRMMSIPAPRLRLPFRSPERSTSWTSLRRSPAAAARSG